MDNTVDIIIGILNIIFTDNYEDSPYTKYLMKEIDCNIEHVDPITVVIIPKRIYISTQRITEDITQNEYNIIITNLCAKILEGLTEITSTISIRSISNNYCGTYEYDDTKLLIDSVRLFLMPNEKRSTISIDIPPDISIEIVIEPFDIKSDIYDECICLELKK